MPVSILVVSLVALTGGLGAFLMGFSLLPTDVGMTWLKTGASLLSGGVVALAIGFATRALADRLEALRMPIEPGRPAMPTLGELPVVTPEAVPESPAPSRGMPGLALGGAAAAAAGAALVFADKGKAEEPGRADAPTSADEMAPALTSAAQEAAAQEAGVALEREDDLFLPAEALPAAEKTEASGPDAPGADEPVLEPVRDEGVPPAVLTETPVLPPLDLSFERELEAFDLRLMPEPADTAKPEEAEAAPEPEPEEPAVDPDPEPNPEPAASIEEPAPAEAEADQAGQKPADVPAGLIADEDLAALETAMAPLAPLDTLEVVGAYDSGGVRFTMYSDGSVNAVGAGGERRYPSLEALRKQLDAGLPAV